MNPAQRMIALLAIAGVAAGCRAPVPRVRDAFSAAGATRIAPPSTNSFTQADTYYQGAAQQPSTQPLNTAPSLDAPAIPPAPPYQGNATAQATGAGRYVATQDVVVGGPPRVRITNQARQSQFQTPYSSAARGMSVTDLSGREPSTFVAPSRALEIGDLPTANGQAAGISPNAIVLPGRLGTYSRSPAPAGATQWQSRP